MRLHPDVERVALLGWHLYPASNRSRAACLKGATEAATCDLDQLERWAHEFPGCGWRVVMQGSGIWGLDVDTPPGHADDGITNLAALVSVHGPLPPRPQLRSGGGGLALFFQDNGDPIIGEAGHPAAGIDPRRGRQSLTLPPSLHWRTRVPYRWLDAPWEVSPPPAPAWLLRLVAPPPEPAMTAPHPLSERGRPYAIAALRRAVEQVAVAAAGTRNSTLNAAAWRMARFITSGQLQPSEIAEALAHAGRVAGLNRMEVQRTLASAMAAGVQR